jgi:dCMP deaminase
MIDTRYITKARQLAQGSPDPSTKVGCIIVKHSIIPRGDNHVDVGYGYNDLAPGTPEEYWQDRELKYPHVVHAEIHALLHAGRDARGAQLYCSEHPCLQCAIAIAAAKVAVVCCPQEPWRDTPEIRATIEGAKKVFARAGIIVQYV